MNIFEHVGEREFQVRPTLFATNHRRERRNRYSSSVFLFIILRVLSSLSGDRVGACVVESRTVGPVIAVLFHNFSVRVVPANCNRQIAYHGKGTRVLRFRFLRRVLKCYV